MGETLGRLESALAAAAAVNRQSAHATNVNRCMARAANAFLLLRALMLKGPAKVHTCAWQ